MSNQRVVVLTIEQIVVCIDALSAVTSTDAGYAAATAESELSAALERQKVIPDELVERGAALLRRQSRACLETVLFPGDEQPRSETVTEWRGFVGEEGEPNEYGDSRETLKEALADSIALAVQGGDPPYDRRGVESRQCGPWAFVEAALFPGKDEQ